MRRALITGIAGFVGGHLTEYLLTLGELDIHGIAHNQAEADATDFPSEVRLAVADLANGPLVDSIVRDVRPDLVFHLAAQTSVAASWADAAGTMSNNFVCQANVTDALLEHAPEARVLVVGSAEEYGVVQPDELPIGENQPFRPTNPYAVSKIAQDMLGYQYFLARGLPVIRVRPFNHSGPRQRDQFVASAFARQVAEAEAGTRPPVIKVGNLDARRDFCDVRDVVRAHWLATTLGVPGEVYNVASGKSVPIRWLLDTLMNLSERPLSVEIDPNRLRPSDTPDLVGDATKLRQATGWEPKIPVEVMLRDLLDYWREQLRRKDL